MIKWRRWSRRAEAWREELRAEAHEHVGNSAHLRWAATALVVVVAVMLALGIYWSREPAPFSVAASVDTVLREQNIHPVVGAITTATLVQIVNTLLDKPGGFINNDIVPPGVWLDDMPSWEHGVLEQARDMTRALRDDFGRNGAAAEADDDLARAEPRLNFSDNSWMLPSSESQYRDARNYLREYLSRLQKGGEPTAYFAATPANLARYLARMTPRLDALVRRLSACVTPRENPSLPAASASEREQRATTPAYQIDDVFYEARGSAWALLHLLRAIEIDFAEVLREKNARVGLREAIRALDATQDTIYSPMILNGSGFGLLANHSLVMASYMARADTAVANVGRLLTETANTPLDTAHAPLDSAHAPLDSANAPLNSANAPLDSANTEQEAKP